MTIEQLQQKERAIWGDKRMSLAEITVALGVVYGDICRQARAGQAVDQAELKKELGNVICSTLRWVDDLGYDAAECIDLSLAAHERYVAQ